MLEPDELSLFAVRLEATGAPYMITGAELEVVVAPPEYVVLRKLEFYREGRSAKHPLDIRSIQETTGLDEVAMTPWLQRLNLMELWQEIKTG